MIVRPSRPGLVIGHETGFGRQGREIVKQHLIVPMMAAATLLASGCCTCSCPGPPPYEPASFEIDGSSARMYGVIDQTTPDRVLELVTDHPEVTTIVMIDVPGSDDDPANLRAARLVREHGLRTLIPSDAVVASGGVDFFVAGQERQVGPCAKLGVHSWDEDGENGELVLGNEVPRDHQSHRMFLDYYEEMGIPAEFYWFTLEAAPPQRIHWMSDEEILRYDLVTVTPATGGSP
jgi:hypothetical protein